MEILIVAATEQEVAPYMNRNENADLLITGVGAPSCMYALTKRLSEKKFDMAIQAGIAGSFKNIYPPGKTVIVKQDVFADLGIHESGNFFTLFDKGFADANVSPYTDERLLNRFPDYFLLPAVNAITVNMVSDKKEQAEMFVKKYDPDIETMEGAAFHYVCISEGIPFIQVRSISNFVGDRPGLKWRMQEAVDSLNENLNRIVQQLQLQNL